MNSTKNQIKEVILFCVVGCLNTLIHLGIYAILVVLHTHFLLANIIGYLFGLTNSYILNKVLVFKQNKRSLAYMVKFTLVNILTLFINSILLYILVKKMHFHIIYSQLAVTVITFFINYLGSKLWAFK